MKRLLLLLPLAISPSACHGSDAPDGGRDQAASGDASGAGDATTEADLATESDLAGAPSDMRSSGDLQFTNPLVAVRPYLYKVPKGYDPQKPTPLVILLHGLTASGQLQEALFKLAPLADEKNFLYAYPDGTVGPQGRFWNATNACCDFGMTHVDDVAYLNAVMDDMSARYNVDPKRIFVTGHSNGGFMAHRLACDLAPRVAAIVALAGDNWKDVSKCQPKAPVAVLQVHGDLDLLVSYQGGSTLFNMPSFAYPSARDSVASWATLNGCGDQTEMGAPLDVDALLLGNETTVERWKGCPGGAAELWTIHGGGHVPTFQSTWASLIYGFMAAHPKP